MGLTEQIAAALSVAGLGPTRFNEIGEGSWPSAFAVSDLAVASIGAACAEAAALSGRKTPVDIDRRLASLWFSMTVQPQGWDLPPVWDDLAGIYRTSDGFVRLHTNAPHHKTAALRALNCKADRATVEATVANCSALALETAVVSQHGCAARLMSLDDWRAHPQGQAVNNEPLIAWTRHSAVHATWVPGPQSRPLAGLKVLDLTRVLAGPVCTRTLAGFGADVLRIDPPGWGEALVETEVTPGKRLATLDLKTTLDREIFLSLLKEADVLVHGYRKDALCALGLGADVRRATNPGLIDVALNAYGWTGPWSDRRGFDSLMQMSSGIAHKGMTRKNSDTPVPLPVQALDFATGYLMAAAVLRALRVRLETGEALSARLSLAGTAALLASVPADNDGAEFDPITDDDVSAGIEHTDWGPARRIRFPADMPMGWSTPARRLHSDPPRWD
ncbi:coa transferase caib/baif family protein [Algimonas arctica]|uniref:Coa transferase caib/baif family protein n=1 Tax=Algimonas arctica TaxID=1479486 RepID=A0A8J3G3D4_9PROT|nr:CoA transferase [Algimonas arctica]GHB01303.1 coa transferase caib/baif family protein [Algimonas arctica]